MTTDNAVTMKTTK